MDLACPYKRIKTSNIFFLFCHTLLLEFISEDEHLAPLIFKKMFYLLLKCEKVIHKIIFACLFSIHNTISLSRHEQECLHGLCFERYFSHHWATQMIMLHIFKGNMRTFTETIKLTDKKKLCNLTN